MIEQMDGSYDNPFKFNAKELDEDTGLYYYGARYYNPRLSIWYGVDPLAVYNPVMETEFYGDGQHNRGVYNHGNLNPYIYTYQNPIVYIDPNGKQTYFMTPGALDKNGANILVDLTPVVGDAKGVAESLAGRTILGQKLSEDERAFGLMLMSEIRVGKDLKNAVTAVGAVERTATAGDKVFTTARAARRAAMREKNIPTSQTYQTIIESLPKIEQNSDKFKLYKEKVIRNGKQVGEVSLHKDGHLFKDVNPLMPKPTYEPPHYHGNKGEHFRYQGKQPRSTNMTGKRD